VVFRSKGYNFGTTPGTSASIPKYVRTGGLRSKLDSIIWMKFSTIRSNCTRISEKYSVSEKLLISKRSGSKIKMEMLFIFFVTTSISRPDKINLHA
jgi:hypothetical protein